MKKYTIIFIVLSCLLSHVSFSQKKKIEILYPTYEGLVMCGYQGWFNTSGDGAGRGWYHYQHRGVFKPGSCEIDLWPDVSEYKKTYKTHFSYKDGSPAYVFSAYDYSTVDLHFKWMKEYGIDGVFMQRFVAEIRNPSGKKQFDKVLHSAMTAATKYGRAICIMYDLSGMHPGEEQVVFKDIDELTKEYGLLHGAKYPTYLHEDGKPLVAIWGVGFNDNRAYGFKEAETLINGMKARGFSVMLGVPTYWRELRNDALSNTELHRLIKKCDIVMPWFVGRYNEKSFSHFKKLIRKDIEWCRLCTVSFPWFLLEKYEWAGSNQYFQRQRKFLLGTGGCRKTGRSKNALYSHV